MSNGMTNDNNSDDNMSYEAHYYVGEHIDGCDRDGPNIVYHYISETKRNGRNLNLIKTWECDLELWVGDRYWRDAGKNKIIMVEIEE